MRGAGIGGRPFTRSSVSKVLFLWSRGFWGAECDDFVADTSNSKKMAVLACDLNPSNREPAMWCDPPDVPPKCPTVRFAL
jgi:hypothetical protein